MSDKSGNSCKLCSENEENASRLEHFAEAEPRLKQHASLASKLADGIEFIFGIRYLQKVNFRYCSGNATN